jgi:hypothetical protein
MRKQVVNWKPIQSLNRRGEIYTDQVFPQLIDCAYRAELLFEIASMEPKIPISFEDAANFANKELNRAMDAGQFGRNHGQCHYYYENFVMWISGLGYSIELTGDEFETASICSLVS